MPETHTPLTGVKVCCSLRSSFPLQNARTIKVAESLIAAGAAVTVLYVAQEGVQLPVGEFSTVRVRHVAIPASENRVWLLRVAYNLLVAAPLRFVIETPRRFGFDIALMRAMGRAKADVYHAYVLDTAFPALMVGRRRRARVIYDIRDFYVDSRRAQLSGLQASFWDWAERFVSKRADLVIGISRPMAEMAQTTYGASTVMVVHNGPWECAAEPAPVHRPVRLLFQGFFEGDRNLEALIAAMSELRGSATLTLQGWGGCEETLRQLVDELDLSEVVAFAPPCDPRDVVKSGQQHDVGVVCHRGSTPNHDVAVPNKLMDYIGAGLAVAGSDLSGVRSIVETFGCGATIDPTDARSMARDLRALVSDIDRVAEMKRKSTVACRELCWDRQAEHLVAAYAQWFDGDASHVGSQLDPGH